MSIAAHRVTVGTTAVALQGAGNARSLLIRNKGTGSVFLGAANVTATTGFEVSAGETISLDTAGGSPIFAVSATGTNDCHVLTGAN